jgi:hypothetical protein
MVIDSENFRHRDDDPQTGFIAVERIYGERTEPGAKNPTRFLRYAVGDAVPAAEAAALGKAVRAVNDKAVHGAQDKAVSAKSTKGKN